MEDINVEYHREVAALTWKIFQNKFSEIAASEIPSMSSKVTNALDSMQVHGIDVSIPKGKFEGIMELMAKFKELDTSERKKLEGLKSKGQKMRRFYSSLRDELKDVDEQLRVLNRKKQTIESCLARIEKDMGENNGEIEEEMLRVKEEGLLKAHIEQDFQDLKTFTWNP